MNPNLNLTAEQAGAVTILHLDGRLDPPGADILETRVRQLHQSGCRFLLPDFKNISAVTSAGLGVVLGIYKMLTPKQESTGSHRPASDAPFKTPYFKLANLSPAVYYVFNVAGFLQNIAIHENLESALHSFP